MKKFVVIGLLLISAMVLPGLASAEVKAGAGDLVLLSHIDFVARFSQSDNDNGWPGYDTYNLEFAVLGLAGKVGDNVSFIVTEAFAFAGPFGSLNSAVAEMDPSGADNDAIGGQLLDARINLALGDNLIISAGRFIPPTSVTWAPHMMSLLGTVNYPLLNGSGIQPLATGLPMIPLPLYQTGMMLTLKMGPASLMIGDFNGSDIVAGPDVPGGLAILGLNNSMDIDKSKGTDVKLAVDTDNLHAGAFWYAEQVSFKDPGGIAAFSRIEDAAITQWGLELLVHTDALLFQAQYLATSLDPDDAHADNLNQSGWYVLAGANLGKSLQILARYDNFDYDMDATLIPDNMNQENATTLGINYIINPNAILGFDYTWRDLEDVDANTNEFSVILELNTF